MPARVFDWISKSAPETPTPYASIDLPKTTAVSDAFGLRGPPDPELLFDALHRGAVEYVAIGTFAINALGAMRFRSTSMHGVYSASATANLWKATPQCAYSPVSSASTLPPGVAISGVGVMR